MTVANDLVAASQWISIIVGIFLIIIGIFGAMSNLLIFSRARFFKTPCAQYILVQSISDLVILGFSLVGQVVVGGFGWPFFFFQQATCISRNVSASACTLASIYCNCLLAFDRWASSSRHVSIRQWSSVKRARIMLAVTVSVCSLLAIPYFFISSVIEVNGVWQCVLTSKYYLNYTAYFYIPCLTLLLPVLNLIFFGFSTYRNISRLAAVRQMARLERQLTRMVLSQACMVTLAFLPYGAQFTYSTVTASWQKSLIWIAADSVIVQTGRLCSFLAYTTSFYIYMGTSSEVRACFKRAIFKVTVLAQQNQVVPTDGRRTN